MTLCVVLVWCIVRNPSEVYKEQVNALLEHGANPKALDSNGSSILHQIGIREWLLHKLLANGVDINRRCVNGRTPLHQIIHRCSRSGDPVSAAGQVLMFITAGARMEVEDLDGRTAEQLAHKLLAPQHLVCKQLQACIHLKQEARQAFATGLRPDSGVNPWLGSFDVELVRMV